MTEEQLVDQIAAPFQEASDFGIQASTYGMALFAATAVIALVVTRYIRG